MKITSYARNQAELVHKITEQAHVIKQLEELVRNWKYATKAAQRYSSKLQKVLKDKQTHINKLEYEALHKKQDL